MTLPRLVPSAVVAGLALCGVWLLTHPYQGIRHDAWVYAGQVLAHLDPPAFRNDLYFVHGSQADYSVFDLVYAHVANQFGIGHAARFLVVASQFAWALSAVALARRWLTGTAFWIALALIYALPRSYGLDGLFSYAEPFMTARSLAEPLALAALAAALAGHIGLAWAVALLAATLHPIMALPGVLFLAAFQWQPGKGSFVGVAAASVLLALLLPRIDAEWLETIRIGARVVMLDRWPLEALAEPFVWMGILAVAAGEAGSPLQRACRALLLSAVLCAWLALLGALTHAELLIQAQPWRAAWLLKVVAMPVLVALFVRRWHRSAADRWLLAALVAAAAVGGALGASMAIALAAINRNAWQGEQPPTPPAWLAIPAGVGILAVLAVAAIEVLQQAWFAADRIYQWGAAPSGSSLGTFSGLMLGPLSLLLALVFWLLLRFSVGRPRTGLVLSICLALAGLATWNQDNTQHSTLLFGTQPPRPFQELIPRGATVYWQDHFEYSWFLLNRANYASTIQSIGVVFSRDSAMESRRRLTRLTRFGSSDARLGAGSAWPIAPQPPTLGGLRELCEDPILDFVIIDRRFDGHTPPAVALSGHTWYLYNCTELRMQRRAAFPATPGRQSPGIGE